MDTELARDCVLSLEQSLRLWREIKHSPPEGNAARWNRRDEVMAVRALAPTRKGKKVIIWAHNGHIQSEQQAGLPTGSVTLGQRLRQELLSEYSVISSVFGIGSYRARNTQDGSQGTLDVGNPPRGSIDYELLSMNNDPALIVDLRSPGTMLLEPQTTRWAGAALASSGEMIANVRPALGSNAIAFVREATPSKNL